MRNWYKNPDKTSLHPLIDRRQLLLGSLTLLCMAVLLIVGLTPRSASAPDAGEIQQTGTQPGIVLNKECRILQRLTYQPCGHTLTRRLTLPAELVGKTRADLEAAYDMWQITGFAADEVEMEQSLPIHCPEHMVLMPDDSGMLCIFRNKYGDALALVSEMNIPLDELPDAVQDELRVGKGFITQEEIDLWLEAIDS